jgi:maltose O-acetyltransferase
MENQPSMIVMQLMFDYEHLTRGQMISMCDGLPKKVIRWLAMNHPDNRTRLLFFEMTNVSIGEGTVINAHLTLYDEYQGLITIGQRVAIATGVTIVASSWPNNSHISQLDYVCENLIKTVPVILEDDVWIGTNVVILPGVTIGRGAIIGAGAVVTHDIPPYSIAVGIPAHVIRHLQSLENTVPG